MYDFKHLAKTYKKTLTTYKISIRRVKMGQNDGGDCQLLSKAKNHFRIRINKKADDEAQMQTLIHEIAHMIAWDDPDDHGQKWGKAYAKSYKIFLDEFYPEDAEK